MKKTWSRVLATVLVLAMVLCMPGFAASVADTTDFESDRATSADELTDADLPELLSASGNHYPIVLVHGLFGWGGTEVLGLNYWGGFSSLRDILNNAGYKVYTPSIGPVASNWDRACELYAYLVGGTVDYGAYHSATNGHARYGRTFPGVLPELNNPDSELKVHLVGHSMGGETIRMLAQLLENGDADERNASRGGDISPLFTGECRHWIESITTLCTPHDGSQYDTKVYQNIGDLAQYAMGIIGAVTGTNVNENNFGLDFKLDQWGLVRQPNESYSSYFNRVINSKIWTQHTNDLSVYDLDVDGAAVLNGYAKAQDDIYYFSVACSNTHREPLTGHYLPNASMNPMMVKSSTYMGRHVNYAVGHVNITPDWWENDGIVSVRSAIRPHENSTDKYNENYGVGTDGKMTFKAGTKMGVWNYTLVNDHYLPSLTAAAPAEHPTGRWGRLHKMYLKEQHPIRYNQLLLSGVLGSYLAKLDKQAEEQLALTIRQMQEAEGVTEALKAADQLEWVRRMNSIRNRAEEIIKTELIFV